VVFEEVKKVVSYAANRAQVEFSEVRQRCAGGDFGEMSSLMSSQSWNLNLSRKLRNLEELAIKFTA
jgi:Mn-containing catalase